MEDVVGRFRHHQLDYNRNEFRLLKIEWGPTPSCTIQRFSLQSAPPYKAVSYRWGTGPRSHRILVNGRSTQVSENLFDFMQQRQSVEGTSTLDEHWPDDREKPTQWHWANSPWLWIDQLCIDQSSINEKNHQVAHMGSIFANALQVLVWLGNGTDGTEEAVKVAAHSARKHTFRDRVKRSKMTDLEAFQKIVSNQYWSRLWIVQEYVLAGTVLIMSGTAQVHGAHFRELVRDVAHADSSSPASAIAQIWPILRARRRLTIGYYGGSFRFTWQDLMRLSKKLQCKDVRDRVYGMLSMVKQEVRIKVDYEATTQEIYERIRRAEFEDCYDRPFSMGALEEIQDDDFDRFLDDLECALELKVWD